MFYLLNINLLRHFLLKSLVDITFVQSNHVSSCDLICTYVTLIFFYKLFIWMSWKSTSSRNRVIVLWDIRKIKNSKLQNRKHPQYPHPLTAFSLLLLKTFTFFFLLNYVILNNHRVERGGAFFKYLLIKKSDLDLFLFPWELKTGLDHSVPVLRRFPGHPVYLTCTVCLWIKIMLREFIHF